MDHTTPAFTHSSPGGAMTEWTVTAPADEAYYSLIDPVRMKGWVGLVGRPTADLWPTKWSSVQLAVRCRTGKVRRSKTSVLPLCYAANLICNQPPRSTQPGHRYNKYEPNSKLAHHASCDALATYLWSHGIQAGVWLMTKEMEKWPCGSKRTFLNNLSLMD